MKKELLRFTTAGSVDDGKSTLIGRLLYDSKSILQDQYSQIKDSSEKKGFDYVDLSLITDGLKSEREQGITIDVAYRYFETKKRKFIIADTPGHIQYTRNMVTGASTANLALILVDARKGVLEQTKRHALISSLLGIKHVIVCINKIDLIDYDESRFNEIVDDYINFSRKLNIDDTRFIPISALNGDNVVNNSTKTEWYNGSNLLHTLENINIASDRNYQDPRFPIQNVIRPHRKGFQDFRGYAGRIESGIYRLNEEVLLLPSKLTSKIKAIYIGDKEVNEAHSGQSICMTLTDDIDLSRGDIIVKPINTPQSSSNIDAIVCWMYEKPLVQNSKYLIKHLTQDYKVKIGEIKYELDVNTLSKKNDKNELSINQIGLVSIQFAGKIYGDLYTQNRTTGSFIIIDTVSNITVGAGLIKKIS